MSKNDGSSISQMRNLRPACEADLNSVGIFSADDVKKLGVEETFLRVLIGRKKMGRSTAGCNATYLYALYGAIHDIDWREIPENKKREYQKLAADIRESGRFK